jgi:hypothetical protein
MIQPEETRHQRERVVFTVTSQYPDVAQDTYGAPTTIKITVTCTHHQSLFTWQRLCRNLCHLTPERAERCRSVNPPIQQLEYKAVIWATRRLAQRNRACRCHEGYWMMHGPAHQPEGEQNCTLHQRAHEGPVAGEEIQMMVVPVTWAPHEIRR